MWIAVVVTGRQIYSLTFEFNLYRIISWWLFLNLFFRSQFIKVEDKENASIHSGGSFRELAVLSCVNLIPIDDVTALKMPTMLGQKTILNNWIKFKTTLKIFKRLIFVMYVIIMVSFYFWCKAFCIRLQMLYY